MAVVATFSHVDIATDELEWRVRLDRSDGRDVRANQERRHDLEQRGNDDRDGYPDRKLQRLPLPHAVPLGRHEVDDAVTRVGNGAVLGKDELGNRARIGAERRSLVARFFVALWPAAPGH